MDDHDEEKRTEMNLFVRSGKSEAEDFARRIVVLKLTTDRHEASRSATQPLCDSRATCFLFILSWLAGEYKKKKYGRF